MLSEDVYTSTGRVRASVNIRKAATKGKLATRTIPVIEDLRSLLTLWQPHAGQIYLFPAVTLPTIGDTLPATAPLLSSEKPASESASKEHLLTASAARP
jgi:hypothetical protein